MWRTEMSSCIKADMGGDNWKSDTILTIFYIVKQREEGMHLLYGPLCVS